MNYIQIQLVLVLVLGTDIPHRLLWPACPPAPQIYKSYALSLSTGISSPSCFFFLFSISYSISPSLSFSVPTTRNGCTSSESVRLYDIGYGLRGYTSSAFENRFRYTSIDLNICNLSFAWCCSHHLPGEDSPLVRRRFSTFHKFVSHTTLACLASFAYIPLRRDHLSSKAVLPPIYVRFRCSVCCLPLSTNTHSHNHIAAHLDVPK